MSGAQEPRSPDACETDMNGECVATNAAISRAEEAEARLAAVERLASTGLLLDGSECEALWQAALRRALVSEREAD